MSNSRIYTRTGDAGSTSLVDGSRVAKDSPRLEAYGTVDELNSHLGVILASTPCDDATRECVTDVQNRLFDIGGYLAAGSEEMSLRLLPSLDAPTAALEAAIDNLDSTLDHPRRFILPQGAPSSCAAHVARTVCRRAERRILALADDGEPVAPEVLAYINRLSDYLFVLSRYLNRLAGVEETYWEK